MSGAMALISLLVYTPSATGPIVGLPREDHVAGAVDRVAQRDVGLGRRRRIAVDDVERDDACAGRLQVVDEARHLVARPRVAEALGVDRLRVEPDDCDVQDRRGRPGRARRWPGAGTPRRRPRSARSRLLRSRRPSRRGSTRSGGSPLDASGSRLRSAERRRKVAARMTATASRAGDNASDAPRPRRGVHDRPARDRGRPVGGPADPHHRRPLASGARRTAPGQGRRGQAPAPPQPRRADGRGASGERGAARRQRRGSRLRRPQRPRRAERPAGAPGPSEPDRRRLRASRQPMAKNMRASQVVSPSTLARAWAQPPRALSRSTSTSRRSSSPGRTTRRNRTFSTPPNSASFPA